MPQLLNDDSDDETPQKTSARLPNSSSDRSGQRSDLVKGASALRDTDAGDTEDILTLLCSTTPSPGREGVLWSPAAGKPGW